MDDRDKTKEELLSESEALGSQLARSTPPDQFGEPSAESEPLSPRLFEIIERLSHLLPGDLPRTDFYEEVCESISQSTGFPVVAIETFDRERDKMVFVGAHGIPSPSRREYFEVDASETLSGIVARTGEILVEHDAQSRDEYANELLRRLGVKTFLSVPMECKDRVLGVLSLAHTEVVPVSRHLKEWAKAVANLLASLHTRRDLESDLTESEERFRLAMEATNDGVWDWNIITGDVYRSPRFFSMLGYRDGDFPGRFSDWEDLVHPEDLHHVRKQLDDYLSGERGDYEVEFRTRNKSGDWVWILSRGKVVARTDDGAPARMVGTHTDITARKVVEDRLNIAYATLQSIVQAAPIGIGQVFKNRMLGWTNRKLSEITGLPASEMHGESARILYDSDEEFQRVGRIKHSQIEEAGTGSVETRFVHRDGSLRDILLTSSSIDAYDPSRGFVFTALDITDRVRAEQALHRNEQLLQLFVEHSPAPIAMFDRHMRYIAASHSFLIDYNVGERTIIGRSHYDVFPEIPQRWKEIHRRCLAGAVEKCDDDTFLRSDGKLDWVRWEIRPWYETEGDIGGIVLFSEVITDRKRAEDDLRASENKYRHIFESIRDVYYEVDLEGTILEISPSVQEVLGYTRQEMIGATVTNYYVHPEVRESLVAELTEQGRIDDREILARRKDGSVVACATSSGLVKDEVTHKLKSCGVLRDITDRKKAEAAVRENEERYRDLYENAPDMLLSVNVNSAQIVECNETCARVTGFSKEEIVGRPVFDMYHPDSLEDAKESLRTLRETGEIRDSELQVVCKDGTIRDVMLNAKAVRDEHGNILYTRSSWRDLTDRKKAEAALRESEQRFQSMFQKHDAIMLLIDPNTGKILDANESACKFYGYPMSELLGMNVERINMMPPEEVARERQRALREECNYFVFPHRLANGEVRTVEVHVSPVDVEGLKLLFSIIHDITDRKKVEESLEESEDRNRQLAEVTSEGILFHENGNLLNANRQFFDMFGYEPHELLGKQIMDKTISPESRSLVRHKIGTGDTTTYEAMGLRKDGTEFPMEIRVRQMELEGRSIRAAAIRDLSDYKTIAKQLRQAQKMESIATLASGIAHDFNNLLTIILGYSELVLVGKDSEHTDYHELQAIFQAAGRGADLVKQILTFSREVESNPRPINLNNQVTHVERLLYKTIPKMIDIELHLADDLANVNADPTQMEQIMLNLAVNSKDAMSEGGKLVFRTRNVTLDETYCKANPNARPGSYASLEISDTGHGMDQTVIDRIFEPFYSTKKPGKGTGLGLAMVFGIVTGHGGHISCESEPGVGTTFRIYIPSIQEDVQSDVAVTTEMPALGTESILLVDDEEMIRDLGVRILKKGGYEVLTASGGLEALDLYKERMASIDLVMLDLIMPEMGGKQCLEDLLKIDPQVRVVIASGYSVDTQTREFLAARTRGTIGKPYKMDEVLTTVRRALDGP